MLELAHPDPPRLSRAEAARRNGARSRGPVTSAGKARASQNALRHGLAARSLVLLPGEDQAAYAALEAELLARYAPRDALRAFLVQQLAASMWRLLRASRLEAEVLRTLEHRRDASFGTGYNPHSPRSWDASRLGVLVRYLAQHERSFWRLLQRLEADERPAAEAPPDEPEPPAPAEGLPAPNEPEEPMAASAGDADADRPNEPEPGSADATPPTDDAELSPRAEPPPCGVEVAVLRQEVERLVAEADGRALERGLAEGRYAPLGLLPETG